MFDPTNSADVLDLLGDKVVASIGEAVRLTRVDLTNMRRELPLMLSRMTSRGLANVLHDSMFGHVMTLLDDHPDVVFVDDGPLREMMVSGVLRFRFKRHSWSGAIRSFPTQLALRFQAQNSNASFPGMEQHNLMGGYIWDRTARSVGAAVISYRQGRKVIWMEEVDSSGSGFGSTPPQNITPSTDDPTGPIIRTDFVAPSEKEENTDQ